MSGSDIAVSSIDQLVLPRHLRDELMVHLLQEAPNESVGMIGVHAPERTESGLEAVAAMFVPGRNEEQSPTHFTMAPNEVIMAFRLFEEHHLHLGAIVHSHLHGPSTPSVSDVNEWNYPEALMMIASFAHHPSSLQAWRVVEDDGMSVVQRVSIRIGSES